MTIIIGNPYTEPSASATDNVDGSVTVTISGSVDTNTLGTYQITYSATDEAGNSATATRTILVVEKSEQLGFSFASNLTLKRDATPFTRIATNQKIDNVLYESSDSSVATIDMNSGLITILKVGVATMTATSAENTEYKSASASFTLTVNPTLAQIMMGGLYLPENKDITKEVAFNQATLQLEDINPGNCQFNVANSSESNHWDQDYSENGGYNVFLRCGYGEVHGKAGSLKLNGQAIFKYNTARDVIYAKGFASDPNNPAGGFTGMEVPVIADIPLGTSKIINIVGANYSVSREIYNDGSNAAGTFEFTDASNTFGVAVGTKVLSCEKYHFIAQYNTDEYYTNVICPNYGVVYHYGT